jgi:DNA-binding PadR family transcriptional regulator
MNKLKEAGYIEVKKTLKGNYPLTTCEITEKGVNAYETYVNSIEDYFKKFKV